MPESVLLSTVLSDLGYLSIVTRAVFSQVVLDEDARVEQLHHTFSVVRKV